jgi:hypothetical protein
MSENSFIMLFFVHGGHYAQFNFLQSISWMEAI